MPSAWTYLTEEEQMARGGREGKAAYNAEFGIKALRAESKERAQSFINEHAPNSASEGQSAAEIVAKQETNNAALNNEHSPKANDVGVDAKAPEFNSKTVNRKHESYATVKNYYGPDGKLYTGKEADDAGWSPGHYDENSGANNYGEDGRNSYGLTRQEQNKQDSAAENRLQKERNSERYRKFGVGSTYNQSAADSFPGVTSETADTDFLKTGLALTNTGQDFSHGEVKRSMNAGAYQPGNSWLYAGYGTKQYDPNNDKQNRENYQDWYDNYSLFSEGGFLGSPNVMSEDQSVAARRERDAAIKQWNQSDEYQSKYGGYRWS
tara:strand:+ start:580 stop:1545 length:966 start_codon:yes stop_codon:yes gene_type:complete